MIKEEFKKLFSEVGEHPVYDTELLQFAENQLLKKKTDLPHLYRYSSADYYNIRGLETQTLYLSSLGGMNDVFEGLSCEINDEILRKIDVFSDCAFLKSFSEDKSNQLMWAHYADNYNGMCVEYDFSKLSDEALIHLFPVYYSKIRVPSQKLEYTIDELHELKKANSEKYYPNDTEFLKDIMFLFLMKSKSWEYEKEWRMIATYPQIYNDSEDIDDKCSPFYDLQSRTVSVDKCICAVYLGPRIERIKQKHIVEICSNKLKKTPVYFSRLSAKGYDLDFSLAGNSL